MHSEYSLGTHRGYPVKRATIYTRSTLSFDSLEFKIPQNPRPAPPAHYCWGAHSVRKYLRTCALVTPQYPRHIGSDAKPNGAKNVGVIPRRNSALGLLSLSLSAVIGWTLPFSLGLW